jgi:hypothetical protein
VLNRLADYGEARCSLDAGGRRVWKWIAEIGDGANLVLGEKNELFQPPAGKQ